MNGRETLFQPDVPIEYRLRHGPRGQELTSEEARNTFPPLIQNPNPVSVETQIDIGHHVLVAAFGSDGKPFSFWLSDVALAPEPNLYYGKIEAAPPDNKFGLARAKLIGFNRWHVFFVRS